MRLQKGVHAGLLSCLCTVNRLIDAAFCGHVQASWPLPSHVYHKSLPCMNHTRRALTAQLGGAMDYRALVSELEALKVGKLYNSYT